MKTRLTVMALAAAALLGDAEATDACTRVVYTGLDNLYVIGRSLDWMNPIPTDVYVYPAGMQKVSSNLPGAITWTSKYGSVYAVGYDGGVTEGMNEKGLSINGLFCRGTVYDNAQTDGRPPMSLAVFVAWLLDLNETTDEVAAVLRKHDFNIGGATFDGGTVSTLHWGVTDASGKSMVFEFVNGDINIYEDPDNAYPSMTNDPTWPSMRAIIDYWRKKGGQNTLPGTVSSPDRCVRADYFIRHVEKTGDADLGTSICRTSIFDSCVPYTYTLNNPEDPNVSSTQWRSFSNLRDKRYYFELVTSNGFWYVDLTKVNLKPGAPVLKYTTATLNYVAGDATAYGKPSAPFTPMF